MISYTQSETTNIYIKGAQTMKITNSSKNLTTVDIYRLTKSPNTQKMSDCVGQRIEVKAWALYEDADKKSGEMKTILTISTPEGETFGTNSGTFITEFLDMWNMFDDAGETVNAIEVLSGTSKAGRNFITCVYAG